MSNQIIEPYDKLNEEVLNISRAIKSIMEELEAVDLYNQRMHATKDDSLRKILKHNRDEEMEHVAMGLEWLRRNLPEFNDKLLESLFKNGEITGDHQSETQTVQQLNLKQLKI